MKHYLAPTWAILACVTAFFAHATTATEGASDPPAAASTDPAADVGLADIVVTAERRSSSAQRTALTIIALTPEDLTQNNVVSAKDLASVVPGVSAYEGGGFSQIRIRGIGGGVVNAYGEPGVAYNIAGVYLAQPYAGNAAYYDLSRVEIVEGPQGTLYGRNATAGAINVIPMAPQLNEFGGTANLQIGNYRDIESSGSLNLPLGPATALRASVSTIDHKGYFSSGQSDALIRAGRLQLLTQPNDALSILFYVDFFHQGGQGQGDTPVNPGVSSQVFGPILPGVTSRFINPQNPWQTIPEGLLYPTALAPPNALISLLSRGQQDHDQTIVTSVINYDLGFATLTVQPAFVKTKIDDNLYNYGYPAAVNQSTSQYTGEIRLSSNAQTPFKWVAGLYYYDQSVDAQQTFFSEFLGYITLNTPNLDSKSEAAFGQLTYSLTDQFRLTGGLRYTNEKKTVDGATIAPGVPEAFCPAGAYQPATGTGAGITDRCAIPNSGRLSFNSTTYKAGVEYDVAARSLLYATVSTGFKAGGFNPGSPPNNTYEPEKITSYDIGSKNRFFDNHVTVNLSVFYLDDRNEANPVLGPINPVGYAYVVTSAKSHVKGAEGEFAWRFTENDTFKANVVLQNSTFDSYVAPGVPALGIPTVDYSGHTRAFSPTWAGTDIYEHVFDLPANSQLVFTADVNFQSKSIVLAPAGYVQSGYAKANSALTYSFAEKRYSVGAYVDNITNRFVVPYAAISAIAGTTFASGEAPRTYGIKLAAKF